jgi:ubiquinone/menaquinone biosynthesis C-methylase UbiE
MLRKSFDQGPSIDLVDEAAYADAFYRRNQADLALNPTFFRKYAAPTREWDWRQWGMKRLGAVTGCKVLDFGCGAGEEAVYLAKMGARVTAIDISPKGIELTRARAEANGVAEAVDARLMRCDPTEFSDASFDLVHGFGILHHVGLHAGLTEVHRVLKRGGHGVFWEHMGNCALIERLRPKAGRATLGERPIQWSEIATVAPLFQSVEARAFHLMSRLRLHLTLTGHSFVKCFDHALLSILPRLRFFASGVVIVVRK